jgi:hypothetical protein
VQSGPSDAILVTVRNLYFCDACHFRDSRCMAVFAVKGVT